MSARQEDDDDAGVSVYADALWRVRPVLDKLEAWLETRDDGTHVTPALVLALTDEIPIVYDQVILALRALEALGVLTRGRRTNALVLDRTRFVSNASFRKGIRAGLRWGQAHGNYAEPTARLVAALPLGLSEEVAAALQRAADDLRAALMSLITSAKANLVLASPFWDDETIADLEPVLRRRLDAGVRLTLLSRNAHRTPGNSRGYARLVESLGDYPTFRALTWDEPLPQDRFGSQTFHFKCAVSDQGELAYLGSANFTSASLRSRMEIGVMLQGDVAHRVAHVIETITNLARPFSDQA